MLSQPVEHKTEKKEIIMKSMIVGIIFIIGGFSGNLALIGTNSGTALGVIGLVLVILGIFQVIKSE